MFLLSLSILMNLETKVTIFSNTGGSFHANAEIIVKKQTPVHTIPHRLPFFRIHGTPENNMRFSFKQSPHFVFTTLHFVFAIYHLFTRHKGMQENPRYLSAAPKNLPHTYYIYVCRHSARDGSLPLSVFEGFGMSACGEIPYCKRLRQIRQFTGQAAAKKQVNLTTYFVRAFTKAKKRRITAKITQNPVFIGLP